MTNNYDIAVIGGGAAGLIAAISASIHHPKCNVVVLEKMEKCGRKIRITGKGKCNLTNDKSYEEFISKVRSGAEFFAHSFREFDNFATIDFFERNALPLVVKQGGRVYPKSEDAWDVVRILESICRKNKVQIICDFETKEISEYDNGFLIVAQKHGERAEISAKKVIISTGGKSYPKTGSSGDGYRFARELGHKITPLLPSLVPFDIDSKFLNQLRGLVVKNIAVKLEVDGTISAEEFGEMEFFGFGMGGGAVFRLSRDAVKALSRRNRVSFVVDFKPALSEAKLLGRMDRLCEENGRITMEQFAAKLFPIKMIQMILSKIADNKNVLLSSQSIESRKEIVNIIKNFRFEVLRDRGFAEAVVTMGGVDCREIDPKSLRSTICEGLSFAGEVMNIDADTGGYNLQIAFSTGYTAGKYIL